MAYNLLVEDKSTLTWDNSNGDTHATVVDGVLTELTVAGVSGNNIIYSIVQNDLAFLNTVLTDLLAFLNSVPQA